MRSTMNTMMDRFRHDRRTQLRLAVILVALAVVVAGVVFWQLRYTGVAMANETYCGYEEHTHSEDCYAQVLICGTEETDSEILLLDAETPHVHDASCYGEVLICDLPEHVHTAACMSDETADVESAADWEATLPELTGIWGDDVAEIARSQVGYAESELNFTLAEDGETHNGYTRYGAWYGNGYGDWDAMFASFVLHYAGVSEEDFPQASGAYAWITELEKLDLYAPASDYEPVPGDLIFLDTDEDGDADHVGIVTALETETNDKSEEKNIVSITVVEGNCNNAVRENVYAPDDESIIGYGILPEQEPELVTYSAGDGGVAISVTVASDALPKDAQLQVVRYDEKSEDYAAALALVEGAADSDEIRALAELASAEEESEPEQVEDSLSFRLGAAGDTVSDTVVLDIFFSSDGAEVEPKTAAEVTIDASELLSDSDVIVESLEVWHLAETDEGKEPVLVAAADGAATAVTFTVDSFSEFEFHYTCSGGGWAGFGANLIDGNGGTISATVSGDYTINSGRYTTTVEMPYTLDIAEFAKNFNSNSLYTFLYATVTDPNYGDTEHTFDVWENEEEVGAKELYGSEENPVVSVTIDGTAATENPNYATQNVVSKTWHFTLTYADNTSVTIPIYGNADGANDNGGKYCPKYLELNLYFEAGHEAVLNLGNGNGTYSDGDYTGSSSSGGDALRYGTGNLKNYADADGKVTINLPSDSDLAEENDETKSFTVVGAVGEEGEDGYLPAVTVELGKEQAYNYKLVGWINIATGEYYDVSNGSTTAKIDLSNDNVFYADWIGADYDHGSSDDEGLRDDTVSTESFVTFRLFDYNELFNLYSAKLTQNGTAGETWTDSQNLYNEPLLSRTDLTSIGSSFIFQNNGTTYANYHVLSHANPARWNLWTANSVWSGRDEYNFVLDAEEYWNIKSPDSTILGMLYDMDEKSLGVHYVGEGDYLFWIDENGYYTYNSAKSGAAYNQSDERFYVYEDYANSFFPYNGHTEEIRSTNGLIDYWFGMYMQVDFYLPGNTAAGSEENPVNQVDTGTVDENGDPVMQDMTFDFSGDDDIMIFVDDKLVVDMSGIHSTSYARINFSTNTVTYSMGRDASGAPYTDENSSVKYSENKNLNLSAGNHTMQIFYMERGASASNLEIQFNVVPQWEYVTGPVQTVTAEKTWVDAQGNVIDPESLPDVYKNTGVEVGLFDVLGAAEEAETDDEGNVTKEAVFGYEYDETEKTYKVTFTDDSGVTRTYVYNNSGKTPTLTYTEVGSDDTTTASETDKNVDSEGRVLDENGYVVAWLAEDDDGDNLLHIRMDKQTLNADNGWYYAWELLDADGVYEVLELSGSSSYTTSSKNDDLTTYNYWSIIGDEEIEKSFETGETLQVILTEAAQEASNTLGNTKDAMGWVIVATESGITTQQVEFSQIAELQETENAETGRATYKTVAGVTSQSEIDKLGSGAIWYVEDAGMQTDDLSGAELEDFHLYCSLDGTRYYLTLLEESTQEPTTYTLSVTDKFSEAGTFCYDSLGELLAVLENENTKEVDTKRVEIQPNGTITIGNAEKEAALDDIRIYTLQETATSGFAFTAVNTFLPDITVEKVDATNPDVALSGVKFTLQDEENKKYYSYDAETSEVIWWPQDEEEPGEESTEKTAPPTVVTEDFSGIGRTSDGATYAKMYLGSVIFRSLPSGTYILTEVSTPDGYIALPSPIRIVIRYNSDGSDSETENNEEKETDGDEHIEKEQEKTGWVITVSWVDESVTQDIDNYVTISEDTFTITLANFPGTELPMTGGAGTWMYTMAGLLLICGSAYLLVNRRRMRK